MIGFNLMVHVDWTRITEKRQRWSRWHRWSTLATCIDLATGDFIFSQLIWESSRFPGGKNTKGKCLVQCALASSIVVDCGGCGGHSLGGNCRISLNCLPSNEHCMINPSINKLLLLLLLIRQVLSE